ncbi:hypothetical protein [Actibacterium lipolyticum]|nr:hypothetical protein [Actibacterium lipolyticum]
MMVFWKAQLAMLAVPKTGTQAYESLLGSRADMVIRHPSNAKHMAARRFKQKFLPAVTNAGANKIRTLAVMREPIDWLGSWFRYRSRDAIAGRSNSTAEVDFNTFVEGYLSENQPDWASVGSQARFVSDGSGKVVIDHLFDYRDQEGLQNFLSEKLGFLVETPPQINVSPSRPLDLSDELRERLLIERAEDFQLYERLRNGGL